MTDCSLGIGVKLDVARLVETRALLCANSGGGKSWALRRLLEQTYGQVQHIVLDPEDEFHTLRERHDYVLAGGESADCAATVEAAALLARKLLELGASAVVGIYELRQHERLAFVRLFLESLLNAPKSLWRPVLIVLDEAHMFCPETGSAESRQAVIDLMTRGRKRGMCGVLATQRPAMLAKDASAQAINKLIGRMTQDIDVKRSGDDLGFYRREDQAKLRGLRPGEFFAFGPAFCDVVTPVMVGPVETTHPHAGHRAVTAPPASGSMRSVIAQLADLPRQAAAETASLEELRARVLELEARPAGVDQAAVDRAFAAGRAQVLDEVIEQLGALLQGAKALVACTEKTKAYLHAISAKALDEIAGPPPQPTSQPEAVLFHGEAVASPSMAVSFQHTGAPSQKLPKAQRAILAAIAPYDRGRTLSQVAIMTGYAVNGGGFNNSVSALRSAEFLEGGKNALRITPAGCAALGTYSPLPRGRALLSVWLAHQALGKAERAILQYVVGRGATGCTKVEVAEATQYAVDGGGFNNALSRLRTLELISGSVLLRASEELLHA